MRERKDIDEKYTWNLEVIYSNLDGFNSDYDKVKKLIEKLSKYEDSMINNSDNFYNTIC